MHSIKNKITVMTVCAMVVVMIVASVSGVIAIKNLGTSSANQMVMLLCEAGEKGLDSYFDSVEQSVEMVSAYVGSDLDGIDDEKLQEHLDRVNDIFKKLTYKTNGVLTYYYRIDPKVSTKAVGFWFINQDDEGFVEHEVTDISEYDTDDTSKLVWFTVPKATGKGVWLPPYYTENLGALVISYNAPVYYEGTFVGVIGIEIDYSTMAAQVDHISLYKNGYAFINDEEGNLVYHPRMDTEEILNNHPKVPEGMTSKEQIFTYEYNGVKKLGAWLPLSNGMRINVSVPLDEINADWMRWTLIVLVIFAVLLVLFVVIILSFLEKITKPLRDLTKVAEQVDSGNYDCKLDYKGKDEVGILTNTFNELTAHLKEYIGDLNDQVYADSLTSLHNKGAFEICIKNIDTKISDEGINSGFAVCMFDCNDLKKVNDQNGHDKGDLYLKETAEIICEVFGHSAVFRISGDEFAAILMNGDFENREALIKEFDKKCEEKRASAGSRWEWVDVARGMAVFDKNEDDSVSDVVRRADKLMYENKWLVKEKRALQNKQ